MNDPGLREVSTVGPAVLGNKPGRRIALLASGPLAWAASTALGTWAPGVVESVYGGSLGAAVGFALARATGWIPFSVAEVLLVAFVVAELVRLVDGLRRRPRRRRLARAVLLVARDLSVVVAAFYLVWGFHYARPTLPERAGWPSADVPLDERIALTEAAVERVNALYLELHGTEDAGRPTQDPPDLAALDRALEAAWRAIPARVGLPAAAGWNRGPVKELWISPLLHRLGLSGFYFPFTGEANVNDDVPIVQRARVMAHEKAHQRGVGPEDEANFLGWLAAATADHLHARYAAATFASRQLIRTLPRAERQRFVARRLPGVQRDVTDVYAYWMAARGPARTVSRRVNHAYLRSNRVEGGVESYGRSVRLLLAYAALRGDLDVAPLVVTPADTTEPR
jgi:hypothetical protein